MLLQHIYQNPEGEESAGGAGAPPAEAPQTKTVDLPGGVTVELPIEEAEKVIAGRDAQVKGYNEKAAELDRIAREKAEALERAAEEARRVEAIEALKAQDIETAVSKLTEQKDQVIAKQQAALKDLHLKALLAGRDDIVSSAVDDIATALGAKLGLTDSGLVAIGADGTPLADETGAPITADALLGQWLADRPHFKRADIPSGSGSESAGNTGAGVRKLTAAQLESIRSEGGTTYTELLEAMGKGLVQIIE